MQKFPNHLNLSVDSLPLQIYIYSVPNHSIGRGLTQH